MEALAWFNPARWLMWIAFAGALLLGYGAWTHHQREIGRDEVRMEWAKAREVQQAAALKQAAESAAETKRRLAAQKEAQNARDAQIVQARRDAWAAAAAADSLRSQLDAFATATRTASCNPAPANDSAAAPSAVDLLADMYSRTDERAGILAIALDRSHAAGQQCVQAYEALTAPP